MGRDFVSGLYLSVVLVGLICDVMVDASVMDRIQVKCEKKRSLSDILLRRKRCSSGGGETITIYGQRLGGGGITDRFEIQRILDSLGGGGGYPGNNEGGGGGGNNNNNEEEDKESDCVIKDFIKALEGMTTDGYVPMDRNGQVLGHSGVTVGGGVDLGSKSRSFFSGIGVCSPVIDRLEPYFDLQGNAAVTALQQNPLSLTDAEASYLTDLVMQHNVQSVESRYNSAIGSGMSQFNQLTDAQRTVISSVLFQYGSTSRVPTFWRHVTNQDWDAAIEELRDFGDKYPTRRNKEADLLENDDGSKGDCDSDSGSRRKRSLPCPTQPIPPPVDSDLPGLQWCSPWPRCQRYSMIP